MDELDKHHQDLVDRIDKIISNFSPYTRVHTKNRPDKPIEISSDPFIQAINQLVADGYLVEDKYDRGSYDLTSEGRAFIQRGGYKGKFEEEQRLRELNKQQLQSVIDTNISVKETNAFQKNIGKRTFYLGLLSAVFIAITTWKTVFDTSGEELKGVKTELKLMNTKLDSLLLDMKNQKNGKADSTYALPPRLKKQGKHLSRQP
jgi:hypothetical protein